MNITPNIKKELKKALLHAFDTNTWKMMFTYRLDENLFQVVSAGPFGQVIYDSLEWAIKYGEEDKLILGALAENPGNPYLRAFGQKYGFIIEDPIEEHLESMVRSQNEFMNPLDVSSRLVELVGQICRIELSVEQPLGTGFLLGPNVAMTNFHVMEKLFSKEFSPDNYKFRFDYITFKDGTKNPGTVYKLADDWLIHSSKKTELDYALLRLKGNPGTDDTMKNLKLHNKSRGWLKVTDYVQNFTNSICWIIQHPFGNRLKLDYYKTEGLIQNGTRIKYKINTQEGSSGAPILNHNLDLVGLHKAGQNKEPPEWNIGIPFTKIKKSLEENNKLKFIDK